MAGSQEIVLRDIQKEDFTPIAKTLVRMKPRGILLDRAQYRHDALIFMLQGSRRLERLQIVECEFGNSKNLDTFAGALPRSLKALTIQRCKQGDDLLRALEDQLKDMEITELNLSGNSFKQLKPLLTGLKNKRGVVLNLSGCGLSGVQIQQLDRFRHDNRAAIQELILQENVEAEPAADLDYPAVSIGSKGGEASFARAAADSGSAMAKLHASELEMAASKRPQPEAFPSDVRGKQTLSYRPFNPTPSAAKKSTKEVSSKPRAEESRRTSPQSVAKKTHTAPTQKVLVPHFQGIYDDIREFFDQVKAERRPFDQEDADLLKEIVVSLLMALQEFNEGALEAYQERLHVHGQASAVVKGYNSRLNELVQERVRREELQAQNEAAAMERLTRLQEEMRKTQWIETAASGEFAVQETARIAAETQREYARKEALDAKLQELEQQTRELQAQSTSSLGNSTAAPEGWKKRLLEVTKQKVQDLRVQVTKRREALDRLYQLEAGAEV